MLNELMDYKTGRIYSFKGRSNKKPAFEKLMLLKVIRGKYSHYINFYFFLKKLVDVIGSKMFIFCYFLIGAVNNLPGKRNFTQDEIDRGVARWLYACKGNEDRAE